MKLETIRKKELAKEAKYIAILDAAEAVIQKEGLDGLSINKVAKKAKIAKGTVYIYFDSKEEIIGGLTVRARITLLEYFKAHCEKETAPLKKMEGIFWAYYAFYKEKNTYHQLVSFYEQNTGLKEMGELATASLAISKYVESIIDTAKAKKVIRPTINTGLHGFVLWGKIFGVLQIIDTKQELIEKRYGNSEKEFYQYFVTEAMRGLMP